MTYVTLFTTTSILAFWPRWPRARTRTRTEYTDVNSPSREMPVEERERETEQHVNILSSVARVHVSIPLVGFLLFRRPCSLVVTTVLRTDPIFDRMGTWWRKSRLSRFYILSRPATSRNAFSFSPRDTTHDGNAVCHQKQRTFPQLSHHAYYSFGRIHTQFSSVDHSWRIMRGDRTGI